MPKSQQKEIKKGMKLDDVLKCTGRIDVHVIEYYDEDEPDIFVHDDITKDEVHIIHNNLTNDLEMQVYCDNQLVYVE